MRVGRISAGGDVVLSAPDGEIQPLLAGITLDAANLVLDAGAGDIGSATQAFEVQLASGGTPSGKAGAAWLAGAATLMSGLQRRWRLYHHRQPDGGECFRRRS